MLLTQVILKVQEVLYGHKKALNRWRRKFIRCRKKSHVAYPSHSEGAGSFIWSKKALNRWCRKFIRRRKKSCVDYQSHSEGAGSLLMV